MNFLSVMCAQLSPSPDCCHRAGCGILALADVIGFQNHDMRPLMLTVFASTVLENPNCDTPQVLRSDTDLDVTQLESGS